MVALLSARDGHHRRCRAALKHVREELVTVWPAVTEAMYLLSTPKAQELLWEMLLDENPRILPLHLGDMDGMRRLMQKYSDRPMDLADAALVQVAEREGIRTIFTVDRKDFEVYRVAGKAFTILP
jgi:predicted nucleic acid-binding protein